MALVAKGDPNNFTFSGEGDAEKLAKITLPSYLFQNQGEIAERNQSIKVGPMFFKVSTLKEYGQYKTRTADCGPRTADWYKIRTRYKMRTPD